MKKNLLAFLPRAAERHRPRWAEFFFYGVNHIPRKQRPNAVASTPCSHRAKQQKAGFDGKLTIKVTSQTLSEKLERTEESRHIRKQRFLNESVNTHWVLSAKSAGKPHNSRVKTRGQKPIAPLQRDDLSVCFYSAALVSHPPPLVITDTKHG